MDKVYILVRKNPDIRDHMVEIMGVFRNRDNAQKRREEIYDLSKIETIIQTYVFVDDTEI